jgi:hypothetical protein
MKRVLRIEKGKPPRQMQFSDQMWEEIRKLKIGGVEWELLPSIPPVKVKPPELPIVMEYMAVKTIDELPDPTPEPKMVNISFTSQPLPKEKKTRAKTKQRSKVKSSDNETTTVRKRRQATKRVSGNAGRAVRGARKEN